LEKVTLKPVRVAVIGGGINGLCIAWELAARGLKVDLFERDHCLQATSTASTKLLHGGLRYLEQGNFGLVFEALQERERWLNDVPQHCHWLELSLPVYDTAQRPSWLYRAGLTLYDHLAWRRTPSPTRWTRAEVFSQSNPDLRSEGLYGGFTFWDGQMDEAKLGAWVKQQAMVAGCNIYEQTLVERVYPEGKLCIKDGLTYRFDWIVNSTGPWAEALLTASGLSSPHQLDLVRGTHVFLPGNLPRGYFLEVPNSSRICFALPYQGNILLGTTEVRQGLEEPIKPSLEEIKSLLEVYNYYFLENQQCNDIISSFAGLRPLVKSQNDPSAVPRDAQISFQDRLITVFGGKWTTSRALSNKICSFIHKKQA
jgi:glycerol-3-phosphate dehydrogenase